jgi:signal transduction histidine kinase
VLLLGIVGYGLLTSHREAQGRAELAAQTASRDVAVALRALLRHPDAVLLVPAERRAQWRGGSLVVDEAVGWLEPLPERELPADEVAAVRQAAAAEFVREDQAAATATFAEHRQARATSEPSTSLAAAAAWQAQRAGDDAACRGWMQALDNAFAALPISALAEPRTARTVAARVLLAAARHEALPPAIARLAAVLPDDVAEPMLTRLRERTNDDAALAATLRTNTTRRRTLRDLAAAWRDLPTEPRQQRCGDGVALWFPGAVRGDGQAALVDAAWWSSMPGLGTTHAAPTAALPPVPAGGQVVVAALDAPLPAHADEVVPGLVGVVPLPLPPLPWSQHPSTLLAAGSLLLFVFAGSTFLLLRTARREALAVRTRSEFLTGVTHELKTPLAAIRLIADVLQDDDVEATRQRDYVALLAGETARLSTLLDNVLDLGRNERGERAYDLAPDDLAAAVRDALRTFAPLAQQAGLAVALHEGVAAAPAVFDAGALQQVLLNLLDNARKYGRSGGRIDVHTQRRGERFEVAVRDHGPGVPAAEREAIFAQFVRGAQHRHGSVPGTGLGLFLARTIAQAHGGTLVCEGRDDGPGAVFRLSLPMLEDQP